MAEKVPRDERKSTEAGGIRRRSRTRSPFKYPFLRISSRESTQFPRIGISSSPTPFDGFFAKAGWSIRLRLNEFNDIAEELNREAADVLEYQTFS
jgi:hypothetical protein